MSTMTKRQVEPVSSSEIITTEPERTAEIDQKHRLVAELLESHGCDALLLEKPDNFAWFTAGGSCCRFEASGAALFITPQARVLVTSNADSNRLFDREIPGAGFQLKQRPWHEPRRVLIEDLCRGRTVASDSGFDNTKNVSAELAAMRRRLTARECKQMRQLGREIVHAVEATARQCKQRQTEADIAGEVAHRMIKRGVMPVQIQVVADGRSRRYRNWGYHSDRVERYCVISAIGRRGGVCVGASRTVCFGAPPLEIRDAHHQTMMIHATGMHFSQNDWVLSDIWKRVARIYDKLGHADEWQQGPQAEIVGYTSNEVSLVPQSEFRLAPGTAVHWHPSIGPAIAGDTVLVGEKGTELLTPTENWPKLTVEVKGSRIECPEILRRDVTSRGESKSSAPRDDTDDSVFDLDDLDSDDDDPEGSIYL